MIPIANTKASLPTKKKILSACVKLFLERGYKKTTLAGICEQAEVSCSSFQNLFHSKDRVLTELVQFMFENQFTIARSSTTMQLPPVYVYAVETAIQMTLTELNENLRDIYIEAYTQKDSLHFIHAATTKELVSIFSAYQPELTEQDFFALELGSAGLMRGYMAQPCNESFPLEKKLQCFISSALRIYKVPETEIQQVLAFLSGLDIRGISEQVMQMLFKSLAMHYEFSLSDVLPG